MQATAHQNLSGQNRSQVHDMPGTKPEQWSLPGETPHPDRRNIPPVSSRFACGSYRRTANVRLWVFLVESRPAAIHPLQTFAQAIIALCHGRDLNVSRPSTFSLIKTAGNQATKVE
jgi:hypothetical protein